MSMPPWPCFDAEMRAVTDAVLRSGKVNYWTGQEGRLFENEYAAALQVPHAIALANGTLALELALVVLGIGPGDEVIVPSRTFIATASSVVMRGATPVIADIDHASQNISAATIEAALTPRTRAVIVVHLAGWPCDMDPIMQLARDRGLYVIEDCAQAHGATYRGQPVGTIGDLGAFSFCQDKILTTGGEGGLLVTSRRDWWETAWSYKDHGKNWDAVYHRHSTGSFRFLHESFGTNWRLTEMQSAIGRVMLRRLNDWVEIRRAHAKRYDAAFSQHPALRVEIPTAEFGHSYYKYYLFLKPQHLRAGWTRDRIIEAVQAQGVFCGSGSCAEIYQEQAFARAGLGPADRLPIARELNETSLMLQLHPTMRVEDIDRTIDAVIQAVAAGTINTPSSQNQAA